MGDTRVRAQFMKQQDDVQSGAKHPCPELQVWEAPMLRVFEVGEITRNAGCLGDDGMGCFTHS